MAAANPLLKETREYANRVSYFVEDSDKKSAEKELIQRLADDYCRCKDTIDIINKYYSNLLNYNVLIDKLEREKNDYMAGLMVKFWREVGKMQRKCKSVTHLEYGDYYSHLFYCIETAMKYRAWQNPEKNTNAQACINAAIGSRGAAEILYNSNLDKNKANINAASLDTPLGTDSDDAENTLADHIADETSTRLEGTGSADILIQMFINKNQLVDAIILDNMAHGDSIKFSSKKTTTTDSEGNEIKITTNYVEPWDFKLVKILNSLNSDYENYFLTKYKAIPVELQAALNHIANSSNPKLYKQIAATRENAKRALGL